MITCLGDFWVCTVFLPQAPWLPKNHLSYSAHYLLLFVSGFESLYCTIVKKEPKIRYDHKKQFLADLAFS